MNSRCSIDGCAASVVARGLCRKHYGRWHRHGDPHRGRIPREDLFWSKVDIRGEDECWEWMGSRVSSQYGRFAGSYAHRFSYAITNGKVPELMVLHSCDNPPCVNPRHLREGTARDNMRDMFARGRNPDVSGERNPAAKLSDDEVKEIREMRESGAKVSVIAKQYNVSASLVSKISRGLRRS